MNKHKHKNKHKQNTKKSYKKNDNYVKYYFSDKKRLNSTFFDLSISSDKISELYNGFVKKYGEIDIIKDYSIYKYDNLELIIFPDGSSFCKKVKNTKIKDEKFSDLYVKFVEKTKIPNDCFPCQYNYNTSKDVVDIIFAINKNINIVLSTYYDNNINENIKTINELSRPVKLKSSKKTWCELSLNVSCYSNIEDIHETINNIKELL